MFVEKTRHLERAQAVGALIIDHEQSLNISNGSMFSMSGDDNDNVQIPAVLMFKDEAFRLLHLLSKRPRMIVYIGDDGHLADSFYEQMDYLESLLKPWTGTTRRWIYDQRGVWEWKQSHCSIVPKALSRLESIVKRHVENLRHTGKICLGTKTQTFNRTI